MCDSAFKLCLILTISQFIFILSPIIPAISSHSTKYSAHIPSSSLTSATSPSLNHGHHQHNREEVEISARKLDGGFLAKLFSAVLDGGGRFRQFPFGCNCDRNYAPVCGTDGMTYPNRCYLHCRRKSLLSSGSIGMRRSSDADQGEDGLENRAVEYHQELGPGANLGCGALPDGSDYAGHVEFTRTGRRCARWITHRDTYPITPEHPFSPIQDYNFPEQSIGAAENFCRNPDRDRRGPWCFTGSPQEPYNFDFCDVPRCNDLYELGGMLSGPGIGIGGIGGVQSPGGGFGLFGAFGLSMAHEGPCRGGYGGSFPPYDDPLHHHTHRRLEVSPASSSASAEPNKCTDSPLYKHQCKKFAKDGYCYSNYTFMKAHCPKSCFFTSCAETSTSVSSIGTSGPSSSIPLRFPK